MRQLASRVAAIGRRATAYRPARYMSRAAAPAALQGAQAQSGAVEPTRYLEGDDVVGTPRAAEIFPSVLC